MKANTASRGTQPHGKIQNTHPSHIHQQPAHRVLYPIVPCSAILSHLWTCPCAKNTWHSIRAEVSRSFKVSGSACKRKILSPDKKPEMSIWKETREHDPLQGNGHEDIDAADNRRWGKREKRNVYGCNNFNCCEFRKSTFERKRVNGKIIEHKHLIANSKIRQKPPFSWSKRKHDLYKKTCPTLH